MALDAPTDPSPPAARSPVLPPGWRGPYGAVILIALVVRAIWGSIVPVVPVSDCNLYDLFARNLASGFGYCFVPGQPTIYLPVGAPFLFSLCYRVFGIHYAPIVILNILLGVGSVALTMALARRWFGPSVAFFAGLLLALWPSQVEFSTALATETPFIFFMLAGCYAFLSDRLPWFPLAVLSGLLFAAATYVRPLALPLPILLLIPSLFTDRRPVRPVLRTLVVMLVMGSCMVPWALRNKRVSGAFIFSGHGGVNLFLGNSPGWQEYAKHIPHYVWNLSELDRDRTFKKLAYQYIKEYPLDFVGRTLLKLVKFHERESIGVRWNFPGLEQRFSPGVILGLKIFNNVYWWAALLLGLGGIIRLVRLRGPLHALIHPTVLIWCYFAAVHALTVTMDRYHFPVIPCIAILGSLCLSHRLSDSAHGQGNGAA
jgi:4-amino-4-deoxy-L-arabinose transferase-like glycosyltransferase